MDNTDENRAERAPDAERNSEDDLESLRNKYLRGGKQSGNTPPGKKHSICNIILLCSVLIASLCTIIWFSAPTVILGGNTHKDGAQNIFSFLFFGKNAAFEKLKSASAETSVTTPIRLAILAGGGLHILLETVICCIKSIVHFAKRNAVKLKAAATGSIAQKFYAYIYFAFFGSLSGGSGADAYYHGYTVGTGMTVGLAVALCCLIAVAAVNYSEKRKTANASEKMRTCRSLITCVGCTATGILLAFINLFGVFIYALNSALQAAVYCVQYSFSFNPFVFPLLNIIIFVSCISLFSHATSGFTKSFRYLLTCDSELLIKVHQPKNPEKFRARFSKNFIVATIMSASAAIAAILLGIPSIGYGWDFNLLPYLIAIFAISATCLALNAIIFRLPSEDKKKKFP